MKLPIHPDHLPKTVFDAQPASLLVYQIEPTNRCNARCSYCPHHKHKRTRGFLSEETLKAALVAMRNDSFNFQHFGEPLIHPQIVDFVRIATEAGKRVGFSTNGRVLKQEKLDALVAAGLKWIRIHTDPFGVRLRDFKIPTGIEATEHKLFVDNDAPQKLVQSLGGWNDLPKDEKRGPGPEGCSFIKDGWRVVAWDGRIALCCVDVEAHNNPGICTAGAGCDGYTFDDPQDYFDVGESDYKDYKR